MLSNKIMPPSQTVAEIFKSLNTNLKSARDTVNCAYEKWIDGIHSMLSVSRIYHKDKKKELPF